MDYRILWTEKIFDNFRSSFFMIMYYKEMRSTITGILIQKLFVVGKWKNLYVPQTPIVQLSFIHKEADCRHKINTQKKIYYHFDSIAVHHFESF